MIPKKSRDEVSAFSLCVFLISVVGTPTLMIFGVSSFTYYGLFTCYCAALVVWMAIGRVTEDLLALSVLFVAVYILLPEPALAEAHYYFWNAPSDFNNPNPRVLLICGAFLGSAASATIWNGRTKLRYSAPPLVVLNPPILIAVLAALLMFAALLSGLLLQTRAEVSAQIVQERGALRQLLLITAPRGLAGGYLVALAICACTTVIRQRRLPLLELLLALPAVIFFNPVAISRQLLLTGFLSIVFVVSRYRIVDRKWILICLPLVSLVLAPALSNMTRFEERNDSFPFAPDFDVHQNIALAMQLVDLEGLRFGAHMIASLSTVLPSELKLFQSEHLLADSRVRALYSQSNISLPIFVEFFVDFGWLGVVVLTYSMFRGLRALQERVYFGSPSMWLLGVSAIISANWLALNRGPFLGNSPVLIFFLLGWSVCCLMIRRISHSAPVPRVRRSATQP